MMYPFVFLVILFLQPRFTFCSLNETEMDDEFLKDCPPKQCGGIEIKLPFRLDSSPSNCGPDYGHMKLSCSKDNTTLSLVVQDLVFNVTAINYPRHYPFITIIFPHSWDSCPLQKLLTTNFNAFMSSTGYDSTLAQLSCAKKIQIDSSTRIAGPISCLGSTDANFVYVADTGELMEKVPTECVMNRTGGWLPSYDYDSEMWKQALDYFIHETKMNISFTDEYRCSVCNQCDTATPCVYNYRTNDCHCRKQHKDSHTWITLVASSAGGLLIITVAILLYMLNKSDREKEVRLKVEKFLESYHGHKPTRYTFKEVKKITKRFKNKLGQGGYGSVYKGELPNGIPVAVKILEKSKGNGEEFINEVSTIGRIHHVNIVRLLGFCSEGSRRALVYEFMPKESLEKYIFSRQMNPGKSIFTVQQLLDISIGIARGIEYLHQGCNQRILHFDIKPHNVLLDYDFKPKIADFGLAKLCSREISIVTMTAMRGTMGYIAPELYSRNFGTVSYKSDVYSFGMLLLEMIGGRKNLDPDIENQSQIYFPEWIYDQVVNKQQLRVIVDMTENEEETARKIALVALWCIQWSPMERPTMTRVLQMLIESSENLQVPPKPFVSGDERSAL